MTYTLLVQTTALINLILIIFIILYRKRIKSLETDAYNISVIIAIITIITDMLQFVSINKLSHNPIFVETMIHINLCCAVCYTFTLLVYSMSMNSESGNKSIVEVFKNNRLFQIGLVGLVALCTVVFLAKPSYVTTDAGITYQYGKALLSSFLSVGFFSVILSIYVMLNPKHVPKRKLIPLYLFEVLGLGVVIIQWFFPTILLISPLMSFIEVFIYFTLENADVKMKEAIEKQISTTSRNGLDATNFLLNIGHDIRVPLSTIHGYAEMLLMEPLKEKQRDEVKNIYSATNSVLTIVNNIVDISAIESGNIELDSSDYSIRKLMDNIVDNITPLIDSRRVDFDFQMNPGVPQFLNGDRYKVKQIISNILLNAVKYTKDGKITMGLGSATEGETVHLRFTIKDTGVGIKEEDYDKVFNKYVKATNTEINGSGTGLGLPLAKELAELMGGTISFVSKVGEGTTFTIDITQKLVLSDAGIKEEKLNQLTNDFDGSKYTILLVDDNELNLKVESRLLEDYKFQIETCMSGEDAIELVKSGRKYDVILLDYIMTGLGGEDTLNKLKNIRSVKKLPPIIAITAQSGAGLKEKYLSEGFNSYLSKPIDRDELAKVLGSIFIHKN